MKYLKFTLLIVGAVNGVLGIILLLSGFMVKAKFDDIQKELDRKNYVEASQYWAGIPIIVIGLFTIVVAARMPKQLSLNILNKVFLLTSLILALAVIVAEAGDRGLVYFREIPVCQLAEKFENVASDRRVCDLYNSARHWYSALVFSAVIIFGSSLMGLLSLFANVISLLTKISGGNIGHV